MIGDIEMGLITPPRPTELGPSSGLSAIEHHLTPPGALTPVIEGPPSAYRTPDRMIHKGSKELDELAALERDFAQMGRNDFRAPLDLEGQDQLEANWPRRPRDDDMLLIEESTPKRMYAPGSAQRPGPEEPGFLTRNWNNITGTVGDVVTGGIIGVTKAGLTPAAGAIAAGYVGTKGVYNLTQHEQLSNAAGGYIARTTYDTYDQWGNPVTSEADQQLVAASTLEVD